LIEGLNRDELSLIAELLEDAGREFSEHGSNDLMLAPTAENRAVCVAVLAHHGPDRDNPLSLGRTLTSRDAVFVYDDWAMQYLAHRCRQRMAETEAGPPFIPVEFELIATLLERAADVHEESAGNVCYDLTFPATAANKALMSGVLELNRAYIARSKDSDYKRAARTTAAAAAKVIAKSTDESDDLDIPDFWLMRYLAARCKALAGPA
jgi:hypothetical protein